MVITAATTLHRYSVMEFCEAVESKGEPPPASYERERFIQQRLERFFLEIGLSRFSGKIAIGYFQTQLQKPDGMNSIHISL